MFCKVRHYFLIKQANSNKFLKIIFLKNSNNLHKNSYLCKINCFLDG